MNFWAIIAAAIVNMGVGFAWYSPKVFGKAWAESLGQSGKSYDEIKKGAKTAYALSAFGALMMSFVLAALVDMTGAEGVGDGVFVGVICWIGFIATTAFNACLFTKKSIKQASIDGGYYLAALIAMAIVLSVWK